MITGIVVALPEELRTLTPISIARGGCASITDTVLIAHAGAGPDNAASAARLLLAQGAQRLISWGCCAALKTSLNAGDLALPETLVTAEQLISAKVDMQWHRHAIQSFKDSHSTVFTDKLLESRHLVSTWEQKKTLFDKTGCAFLDMETIAIAEVSQEQGIPFLAIRAVADTAMMTLPKAIEIALNEQGEVELKKLLLYLVSHISEIPALIKLGLHFNAASSTLKKARKQLDFITDYKYIPTAPKHT